MRRRFAIFILLFLNGSQALAQHFTLKIDGKAAENARLWLYFAGWGGMNRAALGVVHHGKVDAQLSIAELELARGEQVDKDWTRAWAAQLWVGRSTVGGFGSYSRREKCQENLVAHATACK